MSTASKIDLDLLNANRNINARNYWRNRLAGLELNACFEQQNSGLTGVAENSFEEYVLEASQPVWHGLENIAGQEKAKHILLLFTLGVLAAKCSSNSDMLVFTPLYKDSQPDGPEENIIPVRIKDPSEGYLTDLVGAFKEDLFRDIEYGNYPLDRKLDLPADGLQEISSVGMLVREIQQWPASAGIQPGLVFDFSVQDGLVLRVRYDSSKYTAPYIALLAELYFRLLFNLIFERKVKKVKEVGLVSASEKDQILRVFNATVKAFPRDKTLLDHFARQLEKDPDRIAIQCVDSSLTYRELHTRSNQVAHYLNSRLGRKGVIIGVQLDRSPELMIVLFGILKAGCTYLPITTDYPAERINYVLKNSQAPILFTRGDKPEGLTEECVCVTIADTINCTEMDIDLAEPDDIAYVIYTSGSTGTPKGVQIIHRSIVNRLSWMQNEYSLTSEDIILQKTPIVFDVSVWELFWWTFNGAKLVLAEPGSEKDPAALCGIIGREKITVLHFVPSMLNVFLSWLTETGLDHRPRNIRHLFASGEELGAADAQLFLEYFPQAELHNLYGPTEATVDVSRHRVSRSADRTKIPIGRPIDNTTLLIFNGDMNLQPVGIPGELFIGGENLSVGYLNQPALTSARFVKSPIDGRSTLYRTGDLARWLPNGEIEFLGRIDHQVKIRGNRIELGEIEYVIKTFPAVRNAVVLTKPSRSGLQLSAYVVGDPALLEEELRDYMRLRLPEYMIPSYFIRIDSIPVTVNGKLDRNKLLSLRAVTPVRHVPPGSDLEKQVAAKWEQVLGLTNAGIDNSFFRSGGDSILAVRLIAALKSDGMAVSMAGFYKNDTIRKLAKHIEGSDADSSTAGEKQVEEYLEHFDNAYRKKAADDRIEAVYPMSDIEKAMCFIHKSRPEDILYFEQIMQPVAYDDLQTDVLQKALDLMIGKHETLRTGFDLDEYAHVIYKTIRRNILFYDLSGLDPDSQKRRMEEDIRNSRLLHFDLSEAPLWRIILYRLKNNYHEILFEYHHAIIDGWSFSSWITELNNTYINLLRDPSFTLAPLAATYRDYILLELLSKNDPETIAYWQTSLKGFRKLKLNTVDNSKVFKSVRETYPASLVAGLTTAAAERNSTVKNLLLAAYIYTMRILSCENDILVGLVTFNRPLKKDGERMLGCFLNTIPFRIVVAPGITWAEHIRTIDEKLSELKRHEHLSLFEINRAIGSITYEGNPLYDSLFNFINWHVQEEMVLEGMSDKITDRLEFDSFLRGHTFFDANYNVNKERIYCMHEYSSPFMNAESFADYTRIFNACLREIMEHPDKHIDHEELYWKGKIAEAERELDMSPDAEAIQSMPVSDPDSGNLLQLVIEFTDQTDTGLLEESLTAVVRKHAILRTRLTGKDGAWQQVVADELPIILRRDMPGGREELDAFIREEAGRPFVPDQFLFRPVVIRRSNGGCVLLALFHPLVADRYSLRMLTREIQEYCRTVNAAETTHVSDQQVPLFNYRHWQRESLPKLAPYLNARWNRIPGETLSIPVLPPDRSVRRDNSNTNTKRTLEMAVGEALSTQLAAYSEEKKIPMHLVLQGAFQLLLHKYTQQEEIAILVQDDNRYDGRIATATGPFATMVITKSSYRSGSCFDEYISTLNDRYHSFPGYRSLPSGKQEYVSVIYGYEDSTAQTRDTSNAGIIVVERSFGGDQYDLRLFVQHDQNGIRLNVSYNADRFLHTTIDALIQRYLSFTERIVARSGDDLSGVGLVSDSEKQHLLTVFNRIADGYPAGITVVDKFREQASRTPDAVAVKYGEKDMSYRELDMESDRIALLLMEKGVRPGMPVGLLIDRSIETITGILGILKAGGGYLPIDPDYPVERISFLIKNSGIKVLVTSSAFSDRIKEEVELLLLDKTNELSGGGQAAAAVVQPSDLCYVIYTSGTTGQPKGVMVEHRNLIRLFFCDGTPFDFRSTDVWTMFHSPSFDFSVWEIFGALLFGGKLIIVPKHMAKDTPAYRRMLKTEGVTILNQTPSAFYQLMEEELQHENRELSLRYVIFGGEALNPGRLKEWRTVYPQVRLVNMFGITETTVHVTYKEIGEQDIACAISNIGRPVPTLSAYVFDEHRRLVPRGLTGELYIGGAGVTRGYLGQEELTRERFVANPYDPSERLYRSGDLVRITEEDELEYIGRADCQIQLRGFRIEAGEIEAHLSKHHLVKENIVMAKEKGGDRFLAAWYAAEHEIPVAELRSFLSSRLPAHMVPSYFIRLEKMPLTINGKIDRNALPETVEHQLTGRRAASNQQEERLVEIWSRVLNIDKDVIGVHTNYFDLGGHSLNIVTLCRMINKEFGSDLSITQLFRLPTVKSIADFIVHGDTGIQQLGETISRDVDEANNVLNMLGTV